MQRSEEPTAQQAERLRLELTSLPASLVECDASMLEGLVTETAELEKKLGTQFGEHSTRMGARLHRQAGKAAKVRILASRPTAEGPRLPAPGRARRAGAQLGCLHLQL